MSGPKGRSDARGSADPIVRTFLIRTGGFVQARPWFTSEGLHINGQVPYHEDYVRGAVSKYGVPDDAPLGDGPADEQRRTGVHTPQTNHRGLESIFQGLEPITGD
eukprot:3558669-Pyramimonas_sp.AAC.2